MRGGPFEHQPGGCSCLAHGLDEVPDRTRSIGVLRPVLRISYGLLDADGLPIDVEFFGQHERQGRSTAGPHFRAVRGDDDLAIRFEPKVHRGLPHYVSGSRFIRRNASGEDQGAGGEERAEEATAIHG